MSSPLVIIGAGAAGHAAATSAAKAGAGPIVMIGAEDHAPYDRPAISKGFLQGTRREAQLTLGSTDEYKRLGVTMTLGTRAVAIDPEARSVELDAGGHLGYESLLVATGCRPVRLELPGFDAANVVTLRTLEDALALADRLSARPRLAIVGAGLVGSEAAASARALGCEVTLIDARAQPLLLQLGEHVGRVLGRLHEAHGVKLAMDALVESARIGKDGSAEAVVLKDGSEIPADLILVAVGARPETELLAAAGAEITNGVAVDARGTTSLPAVFAAGDIATWSHPLSDFPLRVEHYDNALSQGRAVGTAIAGGEPPRPLLPSFWTDQYEHSILWAGFPEPFDELVVRGDIEALDATVFYLADGRLRAVAAINRPRDLRHARRLIEHGLTPSASELADDDLALRGLIGA